jgi:hypothetical protein
MHKTIGALAALIFSSVTVHADEAVDLMLSQMKGTLSVYHEPIVTAGKLTGCSLVYTGLIQDFKYRNGKYLKIFGNAAIMASKDGLAHTLKVGVQVLDTNVAGLGSEFSAPSRIYLIGENFSTTLETLVETIPSNTLGATFAVFKAEPAIDILFSGVANNTLTVGFNSLNGNSDLQFPISLDVVERTANGAAVKSEAAKTEFFQCATALANGLPN